MSKIELTSSQEDYLETIYHIIAEKQAARAKDIVREMGVKASSVTGALRLLSEKGLVRYEPYDVITLTPEGKHMAEEVVRRHEVLQDFFSRILSIDPKEAETAACQMEHALPTPVLERLIQFVHFLDLCPRAGIDWIEAFRDFCRNGVVEDKCVACAFQSLESLKDKRSSKLQEGAPPVPLPELVPGKLGRVTRVKGRETVRKRLTEMGFAPGAIVEIEKVDGDRVEIRVKGYHRSLRLDDAERVIVEVL